MIYVIFSRFILGFLAAKLHSWYFMSINKDALQELFLASCSMYSARSLSCPTSLLFHHGILVSSDLGLPSWPLLHHLHMLISGPSLP